MENVSTMNLSDSSGDSSMTPLFPSAKQNNKKPQEESTNLVYQPNVSPGPEKNIAKPKGMDSTPLSDIMMPGEDYLGPAGGGADPRFMMAPQPSYVQQQMPQPQGQGFGQQQQQKPAAQSKNPMNLTDEQVEALLAGVVALVVSSGFTQGRLSTMIPKFLDETGKQSTIGMLITALLAALLFYFGRRFVVKD